MYYRDKNSFRRKNEATGSLVVGHFDNSCSAVIIIDVNKAVQTTADEDS